MTNTKNPARGRVIPRSFLLDAAFCSVAAHLGRAARVARSLLPLSGGVRLVCLSKPSVELTGNVKGGEPKPCSAHHPSAATHHPLTPRTRAAPQRATAGTSWLVRPAGQSRAQAGESRPRSALRGALAALFLSVAPAAADTVCHYGNPGTTIRIEPGQEHFADLHIYNDLARRLRSVCTVTLWGVDVTVEYDPGPGRLPDWFRVSVPPGFRAEPPEILIDDLRGDVVRIIHEGGPGA